MSFQFNLNADKVAKCLARNKNTADLFKAFEQVLPKYEITTVARVAAFLAQCGHESTDFTTLKENLNYSAEGLSKVFPKRFPTVDAAQPYHRQPEKIANKIYAAYWIKGAKAAAFLLSSRHFIPYGYSHARSFFWLSDWGVAYQP